MKRKPVYLPWAVLLFALGLLFPAACSKNYTLSPVSSGAPTATPTPASNPNGPIIEAFVIDVLFAGPAGASVETNAFITDSSGNPITNASVTILAPAADGGAVPMPYYGTGSSNPPANTGVTPITGGEYTNVLTGYPANQACTIEAVIGGTAYSTVFTPLAASGSVTGGSTGVTCTWTGGGNDDLITVSGADNFQEGPQPPISSPYILLPALFPNDPYGGGEDLVALWLLQRVSPVFAGSNPDSVVLSGTVQGGEY